MRCFWAPRAKSSPASPMRRRERSAGGRPGSRHRLHDRQRHLLGHRHGHEPEPGPHHHRPARLRGFHDDGDRSAPAARVLLIHPGGCARRPPRPSARHGGGRQACRRGRPVMAGEAADVASAPGPGPANAQTRPGRYRGRNSARAAVTASPSDGGSQLFGAEKASCREARRRLASTASERGRRPADCAVLCREPPHTDCGANGIAAARALAMSTARLPLTALTPRLMTA